MWPIAGGLVHWIGVELSRNIYPGLLFIFLLKNSFSIVELYILISFPIHVWMPFRETKRYTKIQKHIMEAAPKNIYIWLNFTHFIIKSAFNEKRESLELPWTLTFPGGASINNQKDLIERDKGFQKVWDRRVKSLDGQGKGPNGYVSTWRQVGGNNLHWIVDFSLFNLGTRTWAHILLVLIFMLETLTRQ